MSVEYFLAQIPDLSLLAWCAVAMLFVWSGFVRTGLGFGGAALGLPLFLLVYDQPIFWIPVIGQHLLFFSALTLRTRLGAVDWAYLRKSGVIILPAAIAGVFGLISLPNEWLLIFIYSITLLYATLWALDKTIHSNNAWIDRALLVVGAYVAGASLAGAPLMIAVFMRNVKISQLRNTLFVLWFIVVTFKLATLIAFDVPMNWQFAALMVPVAAIGHVLGLRAHDYLMSHERLFRRVLGSFLLLVSVSGLIRVFEAG